MKKISLYVLDSEVELILNSLKLYAHTAHYFYPKKKATSEKQSSDLDMIADTYHQILEQLTKQIAESKSEEKIEIA